MGRHRRQGGFATGDTDTALTKLAEQKRLQPVDTLGDEPAPDVLGESDDPPGSDSSVANGSSIAVILDYDGHRILLSGDAFPGVLVDALGRYPGGTPVDVALFAAASREHPEHDRRNDRSRCL